MNSTTIKLKKLLGNRNTVTIICAVIGIIVLYVGYTMRINQAIEPVTVYYANTDIQPRTKITESKISEMQIAKAALDKMKGSVITNYDDIVNHYAAVNTLIPEGSLFYESSVKKTRENEALYQLEDGFQLFTIKVNMETTSVNSILPDTYVDLYITLTDATTKTPHIGKLLQNVKVLTVKDSTGANVFENTDEDRTPAYVQLAVRTKQYNDLLKASKLGYTIIIEPTNKTKVDEDKESIVASEDLEDYIDTKAEEFEISVNDDDDDEISAGELSGSTETEEENNN